VPLCPQAAAMRQSAVIQVHGTFVTPGNEKSPGASPGSSAFRLVVTDVLRGLTESNLRGIRDGRICSDQDGWC